MSRMRSNRSALRRGLETKTTRLDPGIRTPLTSTLGGHRTQSAHHLASSLAVHESHLEPRWTSTHGTQAPLGLPLHRQTPPVTRTLCQKLPSVCNLRVTTACKQVSPNKRGPAESLSGGETPFGDAPCSGHRRKLGFYWLF